jgi:uncharacterized protein (TIRG00374 family)
VWIPTSVALLLFVAWRSRAWEAAERLGRVDPLPLVAALVLSAAVTLLWAIRSSALLRSAGAPVGVVPLVPMTAFANTINNLTPGSSGELLRLWLLRAHHGVAYPIGGAVIVVERVVAIGYLSGSALISWLAFVGWIPPVVAAVLLVALVVSPAVVYALGLRPAVLLARLPLGRIIGAERWAAAGANLARLDDTIASLLRDPPTLALFALTTAAILACYTAQLTLVGAALGVVIDPAAAWGALGLALTAGVVSLLPFGLGSADLVLVALLGVAGVASPTATAMAFGYRLVSTLPLGLAGVASYAVLAASLPDGITRGDMQAAEPVADRSRR